MKIAAFVKQVEDARTVRIDSETGAASTCGDPVMNPADAYVVSQSIDLKDASSSGVTAIALGGKSARDVVVDALATGADNGMHVVAEDASNADSRAVAVALADAVRDGGFDIFLAGDQAMDYGTGQVGVQIAETLGVPHIMKVLGVAIDGDTITVQRDLDGFPDEIEVQTPVMLIYETSDKEPTRHPSLRGMTQAKRKTIVEVTPANEMTSGLSWSEPRAQRTSADRIMLKGEPAEEAAKKLAEWLREHRLVG